MNRHIYKLYSFLVGMYWKGQTSSLLPRLISHRTIFKMANTRLFIWFLRRSTYHVLTNLLDSLHRSYEEYDGVSAKSFIHKRDLLKNICTYGYLYLHIFGTIPTLQRNPITLSKVFSLNPHKGDKQFSTFLKLYLTELWNPQSKRLSKVFIEELILQSKQAVNKS